MVTCNMVIIENLAKREAGFVPVRTFRHEEAVIVLLSNTFFDKQRITIKWRTSAKPRRHSFGDKNRIMNYDSAQIFHCSVCVCVVYV